MPHTKITIELLNECKKECYNYITFDKIKEMYENSKEKENNGNIDEQSLKYFVLPLSKKSIEECYKKLKYYVGKDYRYSLIYLKTKTEHTTESQLKQLIIDIAKNISLFYYTLIKNEFEDNNGNKETKQNE